MNDFLLEKATYYYYDELSPDEKYWYRIFLHSILNMQNVVELDSELVTEQIRKISMALIKDRPDIFWYRGSYTLTIINDIIARITFDFVYSETQVKSLISDMENSFLYKQINRNMVMAKSNFEKALFLYEYIIKNAEYEKAVLSSPNDNYDYAYGIEGILLRKKAVCSGYSKAFQYFANKHNIICTIVTGETKIGRHAWNLIKLYGAYYYIDATWGDPIFTNNSNKDADYISYDYFCITTEDLIKSHRPIFDDKMPICSDTKYNYYRFFGLIEDSYSVESVAKHIINAKKQQKKEAVIKYSSQKVYSNAKSKLFGDSEVFDAIEIAQRYCKIGVDRKVSYSTDDINLMITIQIC